MMISNDYNDSLLRRYTSSTNASDTQIFYDCGTNNILIPEGKSLGCIHHVVMKQFKHTNTNKSQVTLIVLHSIVPLPVCLPQCVYPYTRTCMFETC